MDNLYITRKLEKKISKYLKTPEIIAVVGPRQCGKTTLLKHIFEELKKAVFLTFDDKKILNLFTKNTDEFIELYIKPYNYIFLDEFHYAKEGGKILKYIIDTTAQKKIFISGSSSADLTIQAIKHLVGRIFVFNLWPFDFDEFLSFKNPNLFTLYAKQKRGLAQYAKVKFFPLFGDEILAELKKYYQEYVIFGGYPRVVLSPDREEKFTVLKNIYNTYFLREVKDILGLVDDYKLSQMIKALSLQIGNLVNYEEVRQLSSLSFPTMKKYLNFLEKTYISLFVKPYFKNKRTEIVKNPKIYFFDTGLRNFIVDDFRNIEDRPDAGALLENVVVMQIIKQDLSFRFWRSKQKSEIDFVISLPNNQNLALEIKKSFRKSDYQTKAIRHFQAEYPEIPVLFCAFDLKEEDKNRTLFTPMI